MDAFNFDNVMVEKANAILRYRRLRHIAKLFRVGELCFALLLLSWTSTRLPFVVKASGDYLRQLVAFVVSPLFIFVLSNVIVITLLVKSGQSSAANNADTDLYEGFIGSDEIGLNLGQDGSPLPPEPVEIVYQDKQIVCESKKSVPNESESEVALINETVSNPRSYKRSQSVNLKIESSEKPTGKLRRSETEKCRKTEDSGTNPVEKVELVDKLSNEDFQRTIEAFIAKQLKFHKEEKLAIVIPAITST